MRNLLVLVASAGVVGVALAQPDGGPWNQWKANHARSASVAAPGPAVALDWQLDLPADPNDPNSPPAIVSPGGISVAENGDIYFKTNDESGDIVYRVAAATGNVLASSENLGSVLGGYGGVAIGVSEVYTTTFAGAGDSEIVVLDKSTLAVLRRYDGGGAFVGLRGTPLISSRLNTSGNYNVYVHDRNGNAIYAVDSQTGAVMWSYFLFPSASLFSQLGPAWITEGGKQAFGHFANDAFGPGVALEDNGDNTFNIIWEDGDPQNFNWQGSGALSADGSKIYVTSFNDGDTSYLWAVSIATGFSIWSVDGNRGDPNELNSFGRPVVVGNRVYTAGGFGVVAAFDDLGATYDMAWEYRDGVGEFTVLSAAADTSEGPTPTVYLYAVRQDPAELVVLRDDGASFTELFSTDLNGTMMRTLFGNNSATLDADGSLYVAGGSSFDAGVNPGAVYKFKVGNICTVDFNGDGATTLEDLALILSEFGCSPTVNPLYNAGGFEGFAQATIVGQDGWAQDTVDPDPGDGIVYTDPDIIADPTGGGMGNVARWDAPDGTTGGWVGAARAFGPSGAGTVTVEWDQYRTDLGDNVWMADMIDFSGWWAIQWDTSAAIHAETFGPSTPLTAGQWQHVEYTFDFANNMVTVEVDGAGSATGALADGALDGFLFECEPTAVAGDGPLYVDNLNVVETTTCATDLTGDGIVGLEDLAIVLSEFGCVP